MADEVHDKRLVMMLISEGIVAQDESKATLLNYVSIDEC